MPLDPQWKSVAQQLPDARAKRSVGEKKHFLFGWMEEVFCVNCGAFGGMVSKEWAAHVFHLCDKCVAQHGAPAGAVQVPDSIARAAGPAVSPPPEHAGQLVIPQGDTSHVLPPSR